MDSVGQNEMFSWSSRTIWQLSQVCKTWRAAAFSLHSCWSYIVLEISLSWPKSEKDVELLSLILKRSQQHLLDITLIHQNVEDLPLPNRMRETVFADSYRWRSARLIDYQVMSDLLYAPLRGRLPQLELLDFQCVGGMDSGQAVISAFKECPRLVEVALTGADPRLVELPRQQITCLRLLDRLPYWRVEDFQVYVHLISQCPLLEVLRVDFTKRDHGPLLQSLTLPRVRNLSVTYPYLLDSLVLPRLEVAALDEKLSTFNPDTLYSFRSFIQRSNCASNLVNLRITGVSLALHHSEPHLLLSVLTQTTKLATLQLEASMFDRRLNAHDVWRITQIMDVMRALKVVPGQTVNFLPRLVSLDIKVFGHTDADYVPYLRPFDEFVCMLKARRAGNQDCKLGQFRFLLRKIHVDYTAATYGHRPVFNEDESSVLRGLAEDGMSLDIRFEGFLSFHL
ncbi:hypothetical protein CPB85DRAFT_134521 [Mucidula mucida]|nr:hypothetical protein CPB85DRAFT_134521 [Mucidula mucida]